MRFTSSPWQLKLLLFLFSSFLYNENQLITCTRWNRNSASKNVSNFSFAVAFFAIFISSSSPSLPLKQKGKFNCSWEYTTSSKQVSEWERTFNCVLPSIVLSWCIEVNCLLYDIEKNGLSGCSQRMWSIPGRTNT